MNRFVCLTLAAILCAALLGSCAPEPRVQRVQAAVADLFDTVTVVVGYAGSQAEFDGYMKIIRERLETLHRLYDIYHEYEGLNNLYTVNANAGIAPVEVSRDIIDLLLLAREGHELSGGAANAALGSVLRIWHACRAAALEDPENTALPLMDELLEAAQNTDINDLVIDGDAGTVFLRKPGMSLDVGSVAKAYAAQQAALAAAEAGMRSLLINAGGNVVAHGPPLGGTRDHWNVGVQDPARPDTDDTIDIARFTDLTLSTSGGYQRFYTVDGQAYHHIIDPASLMPAARFKQVSVLHENAGLADLLSTALFILPYEDGAALAARCNAEALWIDTEGGWKYTEGYAALSGTLNGS
jgi:thiamine biosynthesis lipoprotein